MLVAEGLLLIAESIAEALRHFSDIEVLDDYPVTGQQAVEEAIRSRPDVLLLDYWIPEMQGQAVASLVSARAPETKVLFLSWLHGERDIRIALEAGAVGFLPKTIHLEQLIEAIRLAYAGERPVFEKELAGLVTKLREVENREKDLLQRLASLTPREADVLRLACFGRSVTEMGKELKMSPATARVHLHNILEKTGARTKEEAIAMARLCGFVKI